jgi:hypothetical protein
MLPMPKRVSAAQRRETASRARRAYERRHPGGITQEAYDAFFVAQGGVCAICGRPATQIRLLVDHNHNTGRVRGLLCYRCNTALGRLGDSVEGLERALAYLQAEPVVEARFAFGTARMRPRLDRA